MTTRELSHTVKAVHLLDASPQVATYTTPVIDMQGWEALSILFDMGVWVSGTWQLSLVESASVAGPYTAVPDICMDFFQSDSNGKTQHLGTGIANSPVISSLTTDQTVITCAYVTGQFRYVKAVVTGASSPSGSFALLGLMGMPRETIGFN